MDDNPGVANVRSVVHATLEDNASGVSRDNSLRKGDLGMLGGRWQDDGNNTQRPHGQRSRAMANTRCTNHSQLQRGAFSRLFRHGFFATVCRRIRHSQSVWRTVHVTSRYASVLNQEDATHR